MLFIATLFEPTVSTAQGLRGPGSDDINDGTKDDTERKLEPAALNQVMDPWEGYGWGLDRDYHNMQPVEKVKRMQELINKGVMCNIQGKKLKSFRLEPTHELKHSQDIRVYVTREQPKGKVTENRQILGFGTVRDDYTVEISAPDNVESVIYLLVDYFPIYVTHGHNGKGSVIKDYDSKVNRFEEYDFLGFNLNAPVNQGVIPQLVVGWNNFVLQDFECE